MFFSKRGVGVLSIFVYIVFLVGCQSDTQVDEDDYVEYTYILKLDSGKVFDTNIEEVANEQGIFDSEKEYGASGIELTSNIIAPKLKEALVGMHFEESKEVRLAPEDAFGLDTENSTVTLKIGEFENPNEVAPGKMVYALNSKGIRTPYYIVSVEGDTVVADLDHPLAGEWVTYDITVTWIEERP